MKTFRDYLAEAEETFDRPRVGDDFAIACREECLLETWVCDETDDGIVLHADDRMLSLLEGYGYLSEDIDNDMAQIQDKANQTANQIEDDIAEATGGTIAFQGRMIDRGSIELDDVHSWDYPDFSDAYISYATFTDGTPLSDDELDQFNDQYGDLVHELAYDSLHEGEIDEAKYQGRTVPLGKPMAGDVKKSKVYVKGPKGNVVKVNFGQKGMKIKKSIPGRRKNFRARHNCDNPGPRWKARYWSCRAW